MSNTEEPLDTEKFIKNLDRMFYTNIDPFFYFVASEALRLGKAPSVKLELPDGSEATDHELLKSIGASRKQLPNIQNSLVRMYRYFAAETMIILLLSSKPHDPAYRVASTLRGDALNRTFETISNGVIPDSFGLTVSGNEPTFVEWLGQKIASDTAFFKHETTASVGEFIQSEAKFASARGAINSFKHSRPVTYGPSIRIRMTPIGQEESFENIDFTGVTWAEWKEGAVWFSVKHESEEINTEDDRRAIFYSCLLIDLMKRIRLRQIEGHEGTITMSVPCNFEKISPVRRQNFTIKFTKAEAKEC